MRFIDYSSDLRNARNVMDLTYMKLLRFFLAVIGGWPKKNTSRFKNMYGWHAAVVNLAYYFTQITFLRNNFNKLTFFELGQSYITLFMTTVFTSRIILTFTAKYHKITDGFLQSMHLFNHQSNSEYAKETHELVHKISHIFTLYLYVMMIIGCTFFNIMPLYTNIAAGMFSSSPPENVTFEHSVYHSLPFDYTTSMKGYLTVLFFNFYATFLAANSFCVYDLYLSLMVFHVWGHIKILIHTMENFPRPQPQRFGPSGGQSVMHNVMFSAEEMKDVFERLRNCIQRHNFILDFSSKMSTTFGEVLLFYYTFHQVCWCFLFLELSQMNIEVVLRYGGMTFVLFQLLLQISVIFELLGTSGEKLEMTIYALPWECMDVKNRKVVLLMLTRAQIPMNVKAMNMISIGVQTMITILRTSFSYFILLQTFASTQ